MRLQSSAISVSCTPKVLPIESYSNQKAECNLLLACSSSLLLNTCLLFWNVYLRKLLRIADPKQGKMWLEYVQKLFGKEATSEARLFRLQSLLIRVEALTQKVSYLLGMNILTWTWLCGGNLCPREAMFSSDKLTLMVLDEHVLEHDHSHFCYNDFFLLRDQIQRLKNLQWM